LPLEVPVVVAVAMMEMEVHKKQGEMRLYRIKLQPLWDQHQNTEGNRGKQKVAMVEVPVVAVGDIPVGWAVR
jgi:hypothetical protein